MEELRVDCRTGGLCLLFCCLVWGIVDLRRKCSGYTRFGPFGFAYGIEFVAGGGHPQSQFLRIASIRRFDLARDG